MILKVYSYSTYKALQVPSRVSCYIKGFLTKKILIWVMIAFKEQIL